MLFRSGVRLAIGLLSTWLAGRHRTLLIGVGIGAIVVIGFVVYGLASWSGWPRAVALLVVGLAAGTLAGVALAGGRRARRPVATTALAAVLLLGLAASAAGHGHNELSDRICRMDDTWYRTVAARVAVVSCGPEVSAT